MFWRKFADANESYVPDKQLKRIDRLMEVLKLERFHLADNSMGGMIDAKRVVTCKPSGVC
jgi:hypothetical protein